MHYSHELTKQRDDNRDEIPNWTESKKKEELDHNRSAVTSEQENFSFLEEIKQEPAEIQE